MPALLLSIGRGLLSLVLPPCCPVCACRLEGSLRPCGECSAKIVDLGRRMRETSPGAVPLAALPYEGPGRVLVHRMKYQGDRPAMETLGALMAARLAEWEGFDPDAILVPVPLHPVRMRERGFNQAERLARAVARRTGLEIRTDILARTRATGSQTRLDAAARRAAVAGAFRSRGPDSARPILVVDDVWTTGATAEACRLALGEAGWDGSIGVLVAARTPPPFELETDKKVC